LYTEPALKVSFPDGNRDLVLHHLSHTLNGSHVSVLLKDISRDVRVELRHDIDPDSGILARSARITAKRLIFEYKSIRMTVQQGLLLDTDRSKLTRS
jgi:hypothetical protein